MHLGERTRPYALSLFPHCVMLTCCRHVLEPCVDAQRQHLRDFLRAYLPLHSPGEPGQRGGLRRPLLIDSAILRGAVESAFSFHEQPSLPSSLCVVHEMQADVAAQSRVAPHTVHEDICSETESAVDGGSSGSDSSAPVRHCGRGVMRCDGEQFLSLIHI